MPLPAFPISEQITQLIVATLKTCTRANGYHNPYRVERRKKKANKPDDYLIVLNDGDDFEPPPVPPFSRGEGGGGAPYGHQQWLRKYFAMIYIFGSDAAEQGPGIDPGEEAYEQLCNIARADVEHCLLQNRQLKPSAPAGMPDSLTNAWTGTPIALDLFPREPAYFTDPTDAGGIAIHFDVFYRTLENSPYAQ